jgi:Ca2+-binding RTX toxin-like protein
MRIAAIALLASALAVPSSARADGETCQGEPATIVRSEAGGVSGTNGDDVIFVTGDQGTQGIYIDGGKGDDLICFGGDLPEGTSVDTYVDVEGGLGTDSFVYLGTPGVDSVVMAGLDEIDVHTGDGIDKVRIEGKVFGTGVVDAGPETPSRNTLNVTSYNMNARVVIDLAQDKVRVDGGKFRVTGFDRAEGWGKDVFIDGDSGANHLLAWACRARLGGGPGDDVLRAQFYGFHCHGPEFRLSGEAGDDKLDGSLKDDVLIGGAGRDRANGRQGRDRCDAEIQHKCER